MTPIINRNLNEIRDWIDQVLAEIPAAFKVLFLVGFTLFVLGFLAEKASSDTLTWPRDLFMAFVVFLIVVAVVAIMIAMILSDSILESEDNADNHFSVSTYPSLNVSSYPKGQYVYIIQDVDVTKFCKIGRTTNLSGRVQRFGVELPFNHHVIHLIRTTNATTAETALHRYFKDRRMNGEWFALNDDDICFLKNIHSM